MSLSAATSWSALVELDHQLDRHRVEPLGAVQRHDGRVRLGLVDQDEAHGRRGSRVVIDPRQSRAGPPTTGPTTPVGVIRSVSWNPSSPAAPNAPRPRSSPASLATATRSADAAHPLGDPARRDRGRRQRRGVGRGRRRRRSGRRPHRDRRARRRRDREHEQQHDHHHVADAELRRRAPSRPHRDRRHLAQERRRLRPGPGLRAEHDVQALDHRLRPGRRPPQHDPGHRRPRRLRDRGPSRHLARSAGGGRVQPRRHQGVRLQLLDVRQRVRSGGVRRVPPVRRLRPQLRVPRRRRDDEDRQRHPGRVRCRSTSRPPPTAAT